MAFIKLRYFWILLALLGVAALCLPGQVSDVRSKRMFAHERDVETSFVWEGIPRWDGGKLVGCVHNHSSGPVIFTMDREGRRDEIVFSLAHGAMIHIIGFAASPSGEIALAGSALGADNRGASFVARISADRERQTITRTYPYGPSAVTFTPDGNIWTIGNLNNEAGTDLIARNVLRRFDSSGKMLGSTTLQVLGSKTAETSFLRASLDRVGWFTRDGEYLEFSLDGAEIARYAGPEGAGVDSRNITGLVLSEDNEVVAGHFGGGKAEFVVLDRQQRSWNPVLLSKIQTPSWAFVLGLDGNSLVTTSVNGRMGRFKTK